jgi:hypothetical protein
MITRVLLPSCDASVHEGLRSMCDHGYGLGGGAALQREAILAASKAALERMEGGRRVFLRGRALALAQRMALYARDELSMSTLRIRVRSCSAESHCIAKLCAMRSSSLTVCPISISGLLSEKTD